MMPVLEGDLLRKMAGLSSSSKETTSFVSDLAGCGLVSLGKIQSLLSHSNENM
jgi:hypothetical protein